MLNFPYNMHYFQSHAKFHTVLNLFWSFWYFCTIYSVFWLPTNFHTICKIFWTFSKFFTMCKKLDNSANFIQKHYSYLKYWNRLNKLVFHMALFMDTQAIFLVTLQVLHHMFSFLAICQFSYHIYVYIHILYIRHL